MAEITIDAPSAPRARGGLLSVVTPQNGLPEGLYYGVQYQSALCGQSRHYVEGQDKVFDDRGIVKGAPFTIYRGIDASLFQRGASEALIREAFEAGESFGVEEGFQATVLNGPDTVDITPTVGIPVTNMKHAIGLLEQYAAENYSGLPIIHGNRFATALIPELQIDRNTWTFHSGNGTPIANGGGYRTEGPGAVDIDAGTAWLYITGNVNVWRGTPTVAEGPALKANRVLTLMENTYVTTADCFVAAILVGI
jgi:hypothetical protein